MDDYQLSALVLGALYSAIEFGKWLYNRRQAEHTTRLIETMHDIITVKDGQGRPMAYRDTADQTALQKETVTQLSQLIRDTNENVRDTHKILQEVLLQRQLIK